MTEALYCPWALLPEGWQARVRLELDASGVITAITAGKARAGDQLLDGPVVPGMANLHSHGFQRLIAGLTGGIAASGDSFWTWREAMYRMALRIDAGQLEDCMAGVYLEMLRAGYTSCAEFHYLHHAPDGRPYANPAELSERVFAAAARTGISLTHLPVLYCRAGFTDTQAKPEQRRFVNHLDGYFEILERCDELARPSNRYRVGVAPHSLRAVTAAQLEALLGLPGPQRPVHIHIAEQRREVEECRAVLGQTPVAWLLENAEVDPRWCLVHATHMTTSERLAAVASGAVAGLCPSTEADLGDGIFDTGAWLTDGGNFGIGSDSNLRICPVEELRSLEHVQRLLTGRRNVLVMPDRSCGHHLYASAAAGGGQALGQDIGSLAIGQRADLVELDEQHPLLQGLPIDSVFDAWLFAGDRQMIHSVWVAGQRLVEQGRHVEGERIDSAYRTVLRDLRQ